MDFKELPTNGQAFEQLVRELLFSQGLYVEWSGRGPDGGRDLICRETLTGIFASQTRTWLIQCKHKAHSEESVGIADLDDIVSSCSQHKASGYLLACSTQPSSAVINRLDGISSNSDTKITATYWDAVILERLLSQPSQWAIAQRFMPKSCGKWRIYATQAPNDFVAHYAGYVFHLTNRIGSRVGHHLSSVANRIDELNAIKLPEGHFIRPRAVWYDDKGGCYTWYVDYLRPDREKIAIGRAALLDILRDGWALEDGQLYVWDIKFVRYLQYSDHYDKDHYDYYTRYLPNFLDGSKRDTESNLEEYWATKQEIKSLEDEEKKLSASSFDAMVAAIIRLEYLTLKRAVNCNPEILPKMERRFVWSGLLRELDTDSNNIFTAKLVVDVHDKEKFFDLLSRIPNDAGRGFRASHVYIFLPEAGLSTPPGELLFDVILFIHPERISNQRSVRNEFNAYFAEITDIIEREQK
ncbi:restriction endonuclease [Nostoc favosum]|uniref:Restriction endonuclease n=1 Tax=Nostoc favosum CHAB5714 TaxID=2780399 RepID=A0ABS8ILN1_9NOSO|nr:restriction endonuclease [Nostoc favosum]MCC5605177.1 restriction endonuclease [Nostoc favosum CHAB5714]